MQSGQDVFERALRLLNYTDAYGQPDGELYASLFKRGKAAVNQIYADLWHVARVDDFVPLTSMEQAIQLPSKQLQDVMPYGVAMLLALSEGDGDNQQLYADIYNRKRVASGVCRQRQDTLFRSVWGCDV